MKGAVTMWGVLPLCSENGKGGGAGAKNVIKIPNPRVGRIEGKGNISWSPTGFSFHKKLTHKIIHFDIEFDVYNRGRKLLIFIEIESEFPSNTRMVLVLDLRLRRSRSHRITPVS